MSLLARCYRNKKVDVIFSIFFYFVTAILFQSGQISCLEQLSCPLLSKENVSVTTHSFQNKPNSSAQLLWVGEAATNLLLLVKNPSEAQIYLSVDGGKQFKNISHHFQDCLIINILVIPFDRDKVTFLCQNVSSTILYSSTDGAKTWANTELSFKPFGPFYFRNNHSNQLFAISEKGVAYYSSDFGRSWDWPHRNVVAIEWCALGRNYVYMLVANNISATTAYEQNLSLMRWNVDNKSFRNLSSKVIHFQQLEKFIFITILDKNNQTILRVSTSHGEKWNEVQIPTSQLDSFYRVIDSSEGLVFIHVNQPNPKKSTLYTSDTDGLIYSTSLQQHKYENQSGFYSVNSLRGVHLTDKLRNGVTSETMITFNRGASWNELKLTPTQSGNIEYEDKPKGPLSVKSAIGLILVHAIPPSGGLKSVFVTSDGGHNWKKSLEGEYLYTITNQGRLVVAVQSGNASTTARVSVDEAQTWMCFEFSSTPIEAQQLLTDPKSLSLSTVLIGSSGNVWNVTVLDFSTLLKTECKEPGDFERFEAHKDCVLGQKQSFSKVKLNSWCYLNASKSISMTVEPCPCQEQDFECDYGYLRHGNGACVENIKFKGAELDVCKNGEEIELHSKGYRKIPGDLCEKGWNPGPIKEEKVKKKCSEGVKDLTGNLNMAPKTSPTKARSLTIGVIVLIVLGTIASMAIYFYKRLQQLNKYVPSYRYSHLSQDDLPATTLLVDPTSSSTSLSSDEEETITIPMDSPQPKNGSITALKHFLDDTDEELLQ